MATAALELEANDGLPNFTEVSRAAKAALARTALDLSNGNQSAAARMLGVHRDTLRSALAGFKCGDPPPLWDNIAMGTFDDHLFPFIRTRWDANVTEAFIDEYRDWALGTVLPRCASENARVVVVEDCSAWTQLPSVQILKKLSDVTTQTDALVRTHTLGIIGFLPQMAWTTWFNPMLRFTAIPHRFASTPDQAIGFATELFQDAGVRPPEGISLD